MCRSADEHCTQQGVELHAEQVCSVWRRHCRCVYQQIVLHSVFCILHSKRCGATHPADMKHVEVPQQMCRSADRVLHSARCGMTRWAGMKPVEVPQVICRSADEHCMQQGVELHSEQVRSVWRCGSESLDKRWISALCRCTVCRGAWIDRD